MCIYIYRISISLIDCISAQNARFNCPVGTRHVVDVEILFNLFQMKSSQTPPVSQKRQINLFNYGIASNTVPAVFVDKIMA